jgi:hypothetical protein
MGHLRPWSTWSPSRCTLHMMLRVRCAHVPSVHTSHPSWYRPMHRRSSAPSCARGSIEFGRTHAMD